MQNPTFSGLSGGQEALFAAPYRFGFNGMEDLSMTDKFGDFYNTDFRVYDSRLGRWLSIDPWSKKYPWQSPYVAFDNNPIIIIDPSGLGGEDVIQDGDKDKFKEVKGSDGNGVKVPVGANLTYYKAEKIKDRVYSFSYSYNDDGKVVTRTFKAQYSKDNTFKGYLEVSSGQKYESGGFFKDETQAYNYMWKAANSSQTEMTALITGDGVYVGPNAFNDSHSSWKGYETEVKEDRLYVNGRLVIGQIHTHQQIINPKEDGGFSPADLRNSKALLGAPQLYMAWDETVRAAYWPSNAQGYSYWSEFNNKKIKTTDLTQGKVKLVNMLKRFKP